MTDPDRRRENDTSAAAPDSHGQAALLLVESLIHALIANRTLSTAEAVEIVDVAAEVKMLVAEEGRERPAPAIASLELLDAIAGSLRRDVGG